VLDDPVRIWILTGELIARGQPEDLLEDVALRTE
jgi:hypothetical protein